MRSQGLSKVSRWAIEGAGCFINAKRADAGVVAVEKEQRPRVGRCNLPQVGYALGRQMQRRAGMPKHLRRAAEAAILCGGASRWDSVCQSFSGWSVPTMKTFGQGA